MKRAVLVAVVAASCADPVPDPLKLEPAGGTPPWDGTSASSGSDNSSSTGFVTTCDLAPGSHPESIPENWAAFKCKPGCTYWVPPDYQSMPAPIEWEPCLAAASYAGCRQMQTPWSDADGWAIMPEISFATDEAGISRLMLIRNALDGDGGVSSYHEWVVGDVDGPLDFAFRNPWPFKCGAFSRNMSGDAFAISLYGQDEDTEKDGVVVGRVGELTPTLAYDNPAAGSSAWYVGPEWLVKHDLGSQLVMMRHDLSEQVPLYNGSMNPDGGGYTGRPLFVGRDIVFETGGYVTAGIWAHDDVRGTHPLITYPGDTTRGATNVGTDGVDLVWTYGEGKQPDALDVYPDVSIMTAPYTTDPAALQARRLTTDLSLGIGTYANQFAVGCGYAGRMTSNAQDGQIVRLADGAHWVLAGSKDWKWQQVLGITCDDVFVVTSSASGPGIARVPIVSLGEPLPPD